MEQTDIQFKAFVRLMLETIKEIRAEADKEKHDEKLDKLIDILRKTLED